MTMLAQNTFTVKRATKDGYSCSLSSYSVMLNADSNGVVNGLSAASTAVKLYQGSTAVTPVISIDSVSNCSASISGLNVSIVSVPNNTKSGYVDIKIVYGSFVKIERYSFTVVDYTIVKNYTQTIVGDQMTSYATKKAVDTLGQTVSANTTTIEQNSKDIALKASQSDVTALGNRMTSAEAKITPDAINLTVKSQVNNAINDIQVGGTNLITNSDLKSTLNTAGTSFSSQSLDSSDIPIGATSALKFILSTNISGGVWLSSQRVNKGIALISGQQYTFSMWAKASAANTISYGTEQGHTTVTLSTTWTRYYYTFIADGKSHNYSFYPSVAGTYYIALLQLEYGNKATSWSQAPEDVDTNISLRPTTDEIKAQFTIDTSGISILGKKISLSGMVTFSSLASDAQNKISTAQSTADAANTAAGNAQSTADSKASTSYVDDAKGAAISTAASDATTKAGQAKTDAINAAASDATGKANTALSSAKGYTDTLKGSLGALAWESTVGLAKLDNTIIDGGYIKTNLIDAVKIVTQGLSAQTIDAGNATIKNLAVDTVKMTNADVTGKITATSGTLQNVTISGTLSAISGTFSSLAPIGSSSGSLAFGTYGLTCNNMDYSQQGVVNGRTLRYYTANVRCRGAFGTNSHNFMVVNNNVIRYYVNGNYYWEQSTTDYVQGTAYTSSYNGNIYYNLYLYPDSSSIQNITGYGTATVNDLYGFPVDVIIIMSTNSANYRLIGVPQKKVTIINANDGNNAICFASCESPTHKLGGGTAMDLINIDSSFMSGSRTLNSINKSCWMIRNWYDNNFN